MKSIAEKGVLGRLGNTIYKRISALSASIYTSILDFCFGEEIFGEYSYDLLKQKSAHVQPTSHPQMYACLPYQDPVVKKAIFEIKYRKNKRLAKIFGLLLMEKIIEACKEQKEIVLIPLPAHKKRLSEYGFNQTLLLCEGILAHAHTYSNISFSICTILKYKKESSDHKLMNREERISHSENQFIVSEKDTKYIAGKNIILIDDVITTGSTCLDAMRACEVAAPTHIVAFAVGH